MGDGGCTMMKMLRGKDLAAQATAIPLTIVSD